MNVNPHSRYRIAIIGMGSGGEKLAQVFSEDPDIEIAGVANRRQNVPGIAWAKEHGIFTTTDFKELFNLPDLDIVIDASGSREVEEALKQIDRRDIEIVRGMTANLVWRVVEEREQRERESRRNLEGQQRLYNIGVMLANAEKSESALRLIIEAAMDMLVMSAGSAALFDEEQGTLRMAAAIGFRTPEAEKLTWSVQAGGLTSHILSSVEPTVIDDLHTETRFDTSRLRDQGFRSLIAVPLRAEGKIVGILYVDDFRPRRFAPREVNLMGLLGTLAASAVEKVLMLERAEEMAVTDELTKIFNHRYFIRTLTAELKRAERYHEQLGLCMVDVDHFKKFNDTHGHLRGNEVLIEVARILKQCGRETDIVARYGGEEFAVILPKTTPQQTKAFAERLRAAVEQSPVAGSETQPLGKLTISVGGACSHDGNRMADDTAKLIEQADKALYQSKAEGRNRVTLHADAN